MYKRPYKYGRNHDGFGDHDVPGLYYSLVRTSTSHWPWEHESANTRPDRPDRRGMFEHATGEGGQVSVESDSQGMNLIFISSGLHIILLTHL